MRIGVLPLARPTFDVPYAEEMAAKAFLNLERSGHTLVGPRTLLFDADAARAAVEALKSESLDLLLLLQVTFADASMTIEIARSLDAPLAIWAFPEPRTGGRLRLNAFCGLNLAAHALGRAGLPFAYLYQAPDQPLPHNLAALARHEGAAASPLSVARPGNADQAQADRVIDGLKGRRIGLIGEHPTGFDTCRFDEAGLHEQFGIAIDRIALGDLFTRARAADPQAVAKGRTSVANLQGIDAVDQEQLSKSLALFEGLKGLRNDKGLSAFAVRCWPEMFTEYGCAICGPMGMMNRDGVPAACEADMLGAVTALMLQEVADAPSWLVDIVDLDAKDGTAVFWHCGSAPEQMRDPAHAAEAQIHSNRRMPLLYQFPLKPGRITIARLSQANNDPHLLIGGGEVVSAPVSFTGTSGVVKLDAAADQALHGLIGGGYEHHVAMVYGDHLSTMAAIGAKLGLPVRQLG